MKDGEISSLSAKLVAAERRYGDLVEKTSTEKASSKVNLLLNSCNPQLISHWNT